MPTHLFWYILVITLCWIGNFVLVLVAFGLIFVDLFLAIALWLVVVAIYLLMRWRTHWLYLLIQVEPHIKAGQYQVAEQKLVEALELMERYGPNDIRLTLALGQYGFLCLSMGRLEEAQPFLSEGLKLCQEHYGPNDFLTAWHRAELGEVYLDQGRFAEAATEFHAGMEFIKGQASPKNAELALFVAEIGRLCMYLGRFVEAEDLLRKSMSLLDGMSKDDGAMISMTHSNLGAVYLLQGMCAEAEPLTRCALMRARKIRVRRWVFNELCNLAGISAGRGRYSDAEEFWQQANAELAAIEASPWELVHLHSARACIDLSLGKLPEAEVSFRKALRVFDDAELLERFDIALFLESFASLLRQVGKHDEADEMQNRAQDIRGQLQSQWEVLQGSTSLLTHPRAS
ncbi:MAG: tetratricopeptide repeat protein [Planctomycetes bacterium]|nr:tetratricopeptide repeat protein [Planctomycetota bacterium]